MSKKYDWTITLQKFCIVGAEVIIAGIVSYFGNSAWFMTLAPIIEAGRNFLKNYKK